jgi:hypothetical protein
MTLNDLQTADDVLYALLQKADQLCGEQEEEAARVGLHALYVRMCLIEYAVHLNRGCSEEDAFAKLLRHELNLTPEAMPELRTLLN